MKYDISNNAYEDVYIPTVGINVYRGRTDINQPQRGRNGREKEKCVD
jgi:hypothetical protein